MNATNETSCNCTNCQGPGCTCGCRKAVMEAACACCTPGCNCGENCACAKG